MNLFTPQLTLEEARRLIDNGANVNMRGKGGNTPLHCASRSGYMEISGLLIKRDADVNITNDTGCTPLHFASRAGYCNIAELLLQNGADVNAEDFYANTPLRWASQGMKQDIAMMELLIRYGAESTPRLGLYEIRDRIQTGRELERKNK